AEALEALKRLAATKLTDLQQADVLSLAIDNALRSKMPEEAATLAQKIKLPEYKKLMQMRILDSNRQWPELSRQFEKEDFSAWPDTIVADGAAVRGHAWFYLKDG